MTITKTKIVDQLQDQLQLPRKKCADALEALLEIMKQSLENGEDVMLSGFGRFQVREKAERTGRNPATGAAILLPARRVVSFKSSEKLRDSVNASKN